MKMEKKNNTPKTFIVYTHPQLPSRLTSPCLSSRSGLSRSEQVPSGSPWWSRPSLPPGGGHTNQVGAVFIPGRVVTNTGRGEGGVREGYGEGEGRRGRGGDDRSSRAG